MRISSINGASNPSFQGLEQKDNKNLANVAINGGGGRIGRNALRQYTLAHHAPKGIDNSWDAVSDVYKNLNLLAINMGSMGLKSPKTISDIDSEDLESLLKNDSILGKLPDCISYKVEKEDGKVFLNINEGKKDAEKIELLATRNDVNYADMGVDIVMETSGSKKSKSDAVKFNDASGTKYTVVSAPVKDGALTAVAGVNDEVIDKIDNPEYGNIISAASCTTTCISPIIKLMNDTFGVEDGFIETTHSATSTQFTEDKTKSTADSKNRGSFNTMIPTTTGAAKAVGLVLPELNGKLGGQATRVPVDDGSMATIVLTLKQKVTPEQVKKALRNAEKSDDYKNLLTEAYKGSTSCDIKGRHESAMWVPESVQVINGNKLIIKAYYDNEFGYTRSFATITSKLGDKIIQEKQNAV